MQNEKELTQWPTFRGNNQRTGRSQLKGDIGSPNIIWEKFVGLQSGWSTLTYKKNANTNLILDSKYEEFAGIKEEWKSGFPYYDLAGDGQEVPILPIQSSKVLKLIPDLKGLQIINASDIPHSMRGLKLNGVSVTAYDKGINSPRKLWETEFSKYYERPHVFAADMNGDGKLEVVVSGWEGILVFDSINGQLLMEFPQEKLHMCRKRGFVTARDIDGDGFPEIIIIGRYTSHVNVIQNDGKDLYTSWFKLYEDKIARANIITRFIKESVEDYDNDGRYEIVFNIWNEKGDRKWHIKSLDALTGDENFDLEGMYLEDAVDIDNDGSLALLCSKTDYLAIPDYGIKKVIKVNSGRPIDFAVYENSSWPKIYTHTHPHFLATHQAGFGVMGDERVVTADPEGRGRKAYFLKQRESQGTNTVLNCFYSISQNSNNRRNLEKSQLSICIPPEYDIGIHKILKNGLDKRDDILLNIRTSGLLEGKINIQDGSALLHSWKPEPMDRVNMPIVADLDGDGKNEIILRDGMNNILCLASDNNEQKMHTKWKIEGKGQSHQHDSVIDYGVIADDFNNDGKKEVIARKDGKYGSALLAIDYNGKILWEHEFKEIQSGESSIWHGNLAFWTSAKMSKEGKIGIVATVQRNIQHTGITYGLNGNDGEILWELNTIRHNQHHESGAGGYTLTSYDLDKDGLDEIMCGYGNNVWCAKGDTGNIVFEKFMRGLWEPLWLKKYPGGWVSSILPIPVQTEAGENRLFCANAINSTGLMDAKGNLVWGNTELGEQGGCWQCIADINGDGKLWVIEYGVKGGKSILRYYDPLTGEINKDGYYQFDNQISKNQRKGQYIAVMPVAVDIDGDSKEEIILNLGNTLYCIGWKNKRPIKLWELEFESLISPPIIGDVLGNNKPQIIVNSLDGILYCIG